LIVNNASALIAGVGLRSNAQGEVARKPLHAVTAACAISEPSNHLTSHVRIPGAEQMSADLATCSCKPRAVLEYSADSVCLLNTRYMLCKVSVDCLRGVLSRLAMQRCASAYCF
jgi:hypothetical protein